MQQTSVNLVMRDIDNYADSVHIRPLVAKQILGISIAIFWRLAKSGHLKTYKLTQRTTTVKLGDLRAFMATKVGV